MWIEEQAFLPRTPPRELLYIIIIKPINLSMALYIPYSHVCYSPEMNLSWRRMLSRNKPKEPGWTWNWREPWEAVESEFDQRNLHVLGMWDQDDSCRYSRKGTNVGHSWLANVVCASNHIICDSSHSIAALWSWVSRDHISGEHKGNFYNIQCWQTIMREAKKISSYLFLIPWSLLLHRHHQ